MITSNRKTLLQRICLIGTVILISLYTGYGQQPCKRVLLVIDIQENLVNPNSKMHVDTAGIDLFFLNINTTIVKFDQKHDPVVYIVNEWTNPFMNWGTGNVCKKGGTGVGIDKRLLLVNNVVYSKSKPNALSNVFLLKYLKDNEITDVYVTGLFAEGCVKATIKGLLEEKFNVVVVEDALGSKNNSKKAAVVDYLNCNKIKTIKTQEI